MTHKRHITWHISLLHNRVNETILNIILTDEGACIALTCFPKISYHKKARIKKETIVSYIPKQNGVAKRKNRSIVKVSRVMIHDPKLSKFLCGESTNTMVYVQNRAPHQALDNKTPKEVFTSVNPSIGHLRIFGCPVYFHMLKDKRNNMEAIGRKGTIFKYFENSKAFRIYISSQRNIKFSRDVTFNEDNALRKVRDLPAPPPLEKKDDDMDL